MGYRTAVVVATWEGAPAEWLEGLARSLGRFPAGVGHELFVCANGARYRLPARLSPAVAGVFVRENRGYNLGAWDHAWRRLEGFERFLFLQDDCRARRAGWLRAFERVFDASAGCGLVGENFSPGWSRPWDELCARSRRASRARAYRGRLARWGIPEGSSARHLTTVVQYTSRGVLEAVHGYALGETYEEAIAAEIGFSRSIEAIGLRLEQVGRWRHSFVAHREWASDHPLQRLVRSARKRIGRTRHPTVGQGSGDRG